MIDKVQNIEHFKTQYRAIVHELVQCRKQAGVTQEFLSEWIGIDRRKLIAFEGLKKIDLQTLLKYSDKFSVDINMTFQIN